MSGTPTPAPHPDRPPRWTRWSICFAAWAALVFTGTHWPKLRVAEAGRTDLILHLSAFAPWTILLALCSFFGPRFSMQNIGASTIIALAYAAFDETTQAIPVLGRTAALDDFGADCAGVLAGALILVAVARIRSQRNPVS